MTIGRRALAGAAFGALLTLLLHPVSRPFLLTFAQRMPVERVEQCLDHSADALPPPRDLLEASLWVNMALERANLRDAPLSEREVETVLAIATRAADRDPDNAFWRQARAAILLASGHPMESKVVWIRAARAKTWNDYQSERLNRARDKIARLTGSSQSWQLAYVYHRRSVAAAITIEKYARAVLGDADPATPEGLAIRYATLMNGNLIRRGARSVLVGERGANIVDLTTYPANMQNVPTPRTLWTGQTDMLDRMAQLGPEWQDKADVARAVYANNEGWRALMGYQDPQNLPQKLSFGSIVAAGFTGGIAVIATTGALLFGLGLLSERFLGGRTNLGIPCVVGISGLLGVGGGVLMGDYFAGLAISLCAAFLALTPPQLRRARPQQLGPLFTFFVILIAIAFSVAVMAYLLGQTAPATILLPELGMPADYYQTPMFLGLAAVPLGFLLLAVPMWSLAQRIAPTHVLTLALKKLGTFLGVGGLACGILLTPVAVYADRTLGETLGQLVGNEPVFYYIRQ